MKKKYLIISIGAASILLLATLNSTIATNLINETDHQKTLSSPLFTARTLRSNKMTNTIGTSAYLGKGQTQSLFSSKNLITLPQLEHAMHILEAQPHRLLTIYEKIKHMPWFIKFKNNNLGSIDLANYIKTISRNPQKLHQELTKALDVITINIDPTNEDTQPLSLSTSSALACFITIIALLPVALILTMMIATILIVTCLNLGGCFENIWAGIMGGILQDLTPPQ